MNRGFFRSIRIRVAQYLKECLKPSVLIQVLLLISVIWYSYETRRLRVVSEKQTDFLERQVEFQSRPILDIEFEQTSMQSVDKPVPKSRISQIGNSANGPVWNPILVSYSDQTTQNIVTIYFNKATRSYTWSGWLPVCSQR